VQGNFCIARSENSCIWPIIKEANVSHEGYLSSSVSLVFTSEFSRIRSSWEADSEGISLIRDLDRYLKKLQEIGISLPNPAEIRAYWLRFPDMIEATLYIAELVKQNFPQAILKLEIYKDPEIPDEYLLLKIREKQQEINILEKIEEVEEKFAEVLVTKKGWLLLTPDF